MTPTRILLLAALLGLVPPASASELQTFLDETLSAYEKAAADCVQELHRHVGSRDPAVRAAADGARFRANLFLQARANLKKAQDELATIEVTGESGAGLVKVTMTCKHDVKRVTIDPSLLAEDKDMLEDLVAAAFNAAVRKAEETSQEKMGKLTAGMPGLPGGMKFPF